jgi:hypothetical protein
MEQDNIDITIFEPSAEFDFSKLSLARPSNISSDGSSFITKIYYANKPLYVETCKSVTRQGIVKNGKRYCCDLMFENNSEYFGQWLELLQERIQHLILEKNESWFQNSLTMTDIEDSFIPVMKIYKSGKYYLVRTTIKNNVVTNAPMIKIFDANENVMDIQHVTPQTNIVSILDISRVRFTGKNFEIEIELKQVQSVHSVFEKCLIKKKSVSYLEPEPPSFRKTREQEFHEEEVEETQEVQEVEETQQVNEVQEVQVKEEVKEVQEVKVEEQNKVENVFVEVNPKKELIDLEDIDLAQLEEVGISLEGKGEREKEEDPLKKKEEDKSEIYEMYKKAREKAKEIKRQAILAFLEAKNIKKTYLLENMEEESDGDGDSEF